MVKKYKKIGMVKEIKIYVKVKKIGNSKGIIIEKDIADLIKLEIGDYLEISLQKINKEDYLLKNNKEKPEEKTD
ncbi:hypothetical protein LCGC14_0804720 [marine sediment metagenome]|uniref:SpoVT-AbrB domain-containing protein n=1 Tax=marine sediment metagenome TaxID=412755 RepID=A0A0F9PT06_9ZZZZ|nr:hypothetical protein [archaeon]